MYIAVSPQYAVMRLFLKDTVSSLSLQKKKIQVRFHDKMVLNKKRYNIYCTRKEKKKEVFLDIFSPNVIITCKNREGTLE